MSEEITEVPDKVVLLADRRSSLGLPKPAEPPPPPPPVAGVIEVLERTLEAAREGRVRAVGIAYVTTEAVGTNWAYAPEAMLKFELLASTDFLHDRIRSAIDQTGEPTGE